MSEEKRGVFPDTRWSLLQVVNRENNESRRNALEQLLRVYLPILESYLIKQRKLGIDEAKDLLHSFISDKVLAGTLLANADRQRGKFRNLIVKALNNYQISTLRKKERELSRRGVNLTIDHEFVDVTTQNELFDTFWARQIMDNALKAMRTECAEKSRDDLWALFDIRIVQPACYNQPPISYKKLVSSMDISSPREAINLLVTAKRMFVRALRAEIGRYTDGAEEIDSEIIELKRILTRMNG